MRRACRLASFKYTVFGPHKEKKHRRRGEKVFFRIQIQTRPLRRQKMSRMFFSFSPSSRFFFLLFLDFSRQGQMCLSVGLLASLVVHHSAFSSFYFYFFFSPVFVHTVCIRYWLQGTTSYFFNLVDNNRKIETEKNPACMHASRSSWIRLYIDLFYLALYVNIKY